LLRLLQDCHQQRRQQPQQGHQQQQRRLVQLQLLRVGLSVSSSLQKPCGQPCRIRPRAHLVPLGRQVGLLLQLLMVLLSRQTMQPQRSACPPTQWRCLRQQQTHPQQQKQLLLLGQLAQAQVRQPPWTQTWPNSQHSRSSSLLRSKQAARLPWRQSPHPLLVLLLVVRQQQTPCRQHCAKQRKRLALTGLS
jgi:hypothetical protein